MEQLDIMNGVKNSLTNLKGELDGYQESKGNYMDSFKDQSAGNNSLLADNASNIFTGETPFSIGTGGHLFFQGKDGTSMAYKDVKMPFKKDYRTALQYNDLFTPIYNSGSYDTTKQKIFEDRIRAMMSSNPDGMKSIIADQLSSFGNYEDLIPLLDDPANFKERIGPDGKKISSVTDMFVERASEAARKAAAEGKAKKEKDRNTQTGETSTHYGPQYYTDNQGRRVSFRESKMPGKYEDITKYLPMGNSAPSPPQPSTENNDFAENSREEEIKQALEGGIDPKQVFTDATDEEINAIKKKYNIK
jgi:hypothetical protein